MNERIYLSPPRLGGEETGLVLDALASGWITPLGPHVDAFEEEFAAAVGARHAAALSSGTAALHLALILAGVRPGDEVLVSTLTFAASVNPVLYLGARPVFIDSERESWNMDPDLLQQTLRRKAEAGCLPRAVVLVHLYGQSADIDPILAACDEFGVPLIEDAAEALGASYRGRAPGTRGRFGVFSFNGNKIITSAGGGMLVSDDAAAVAHARKLASQSREPVPWYEHREVGFNYRLSNVLAALGRAQLADLENRVQRRRAIFHAYEHELAGLPGLRFMPDAGWGRHSRWLTVLTIDPEQAGVDREAIRLALEARQVESRPVWKPMHLQPVFAGFEAVGGTVAEDLFRRGLCLPSGCGMSHDDLARVTTAVAAACAGGTPERTEPRPQM